MLKICTANKTVFQNQALSIKFGKSQFSNSQLKSQQFSKFSGYNVTVTVLLTRMLQSRQGWQSIRLADQARRVDVGSGLVASAADVSTSLLLLLLR